MIAHLIRWSVRNRFFVMIGVLTLIGVGVWAVRSTAIDALPDLSDTQVIIRTIKDVKVDERIKIFDTLKEKYGLEWTPGLLSGSLKVSEKKSCKEKSF